jgi:hypothetical protein
MLGAESALAAALGPAATVDARVARRVDDGIARLEEYRAAGRLATAAAVVIHLGTNGPLSDSQFERLAEVVAGVPRVVIVNVRVPRRWEAASNGAIAGGVPRHAAMRLVDWYGASGAPGMVGTDGTHVTPDGARRYAELVAAAAGGQG